MGAEKALQRLRESENLRELKLLKDVNFIMQNDDNFARAYRICNFLTQKDACKNRVKNKKSNESRFNYIMNNKL